jgi:MATE family multidrug resistance protein
MTEGYTTHYKKNFTLAYPVMLSQLGHVLVGVADNLMVGKLGAVPLAASSLANAVFFLLLTFGIGVSYAITPLVAAADGADNRSTIAQVLKHGLLINIVTGVLLFVIVLLGGNALNFMNQPEDVVALAIPYLAVITFSVIPFMLFQTFRQFAEGLSMTKQAMYITVSANIMNVILNYIFIYGKLGVPAMGLLGAGWATLISRVLMGLMMLGFVYYHKTFKQYRAGFSLGNYSMAYIKKMLGIGVPAAFQFAFEVSAFAGAAIVIGWFGANALAAHQIAINFVSISYMMASGLSAAATIRVGNQLGKEDIITLRRAAFTIFIMVGAFMVVCGIIFYFGRYYFPSFYINDSEVINLAASLIVIAAFFQLSDGIQVVSLGALRGLKDVKVPTIVTFIAYWVLGLPIGYWLGFKYDYGPIGIWIGLLIGLSAAAIMLSFRFNRLTNRLLKKHR